MIYISVYLMHRICLLSISDMHRCCSVELKDANAESNGVSRRVGPVRQRREMRGPSSRTSATLTSIPWPRIGHPGGVTCICGLWLAEAGPTCPNKNKERKAVYMYLRLLTTVEIVALFCINTLLKHSQICLKCVSLLFQRRTLIYFLSTPHT